MIEVSARERRREIVSFSEQKKSHIAWAKLRWFVANVISLFFSILMIKLTNYNRKNIKEVGFFTGIINL